MDACPTIASIVCSADTPLDQFPYAGWVPTVNGRLSFRHVGEARHPSESVYANIISEHKRRVILAYQRRNLSDILFAPAIHYLCNISGDFWFVLAATSSRSAEESDQLFGQIAVFKSKEDWRQKAEKIARPAIAEMNALRFSMSPERDQTIESTFVAARDSVIALADIRIDFHLHRTGEVYFGRPSFADTDLEFASQNYAKECGHDFPKWVADQCYFFLRDLSHTHQHHAPSSDTILILQERDTGDVEWRRNIIFSLAHYTIRTKRFGDPPSLFQSMGVQAYSLSFKEICQERLGSLANQIPKFNDEALMHSLSARAQEALACQAQLSNTASISFSKAANWRTFSLAIVAIAIATLAILVQPRISAESRQQFPRLNQLSDYAAEHFLTIVAISGLFIALVWLLTRAGWVTRTDVGRDLLEIANIKRGWALASALLISVVSFGVTMWIARAAVENIWNAVTDFCRVFL